ncbi:MAG: outer membrane lipoprotein-sorting protein [Myxococcales bacterium]|nr:outer membrane lipoprotein-sorting protein [Myxococcales bacterium]
MLTGTANLLAAEPVADDDLARQLVLELDERQRASGDFKALALIEQKESGKNDLVYQSVVYRRDEADKLLILFLKPQSEAGKGYLRVDENLFLYDPTVGKWERRTEREKIMGTDTRRADFDESRLAEEYVPHYLGEETLGKYSVHRIELVAKEGVDVAYPRLELWIDQESRNLLKRQDFALSGKLMRTTYYPRWMKVFSQSKNDYVYFPEEIRVFDEVQEGNRTTMAITKVDLAELDPNIFTKAWLESKSR